MEIEAELVQLPATRASVCPHRSIRSCCKCVTAFLEKLRRKINKWQSQEAPSHPRCKFALSVALRLLMNENKSSAAVTRYYLHPCFPADEIQNPES